jgi:hypothetical protein
MYKKKYTSSRFNKSFKEYNDDEKKKENENLKVADKIIKKIIKKDEPLKKLNQNLEKKNKLKPINTNILLKGFI